MADAARRAIVVQRVDGYGQGDAAAISIVPGAPSGLRWRLALTARIPAHRYSDFCGASSQSMQMTFATPAYVTRR